MKKTKRRKTKPRGRDSGDDFFRVLTHELKSPLTPIQTYLHLLRSETSGSLNKRQKGELDIISNNIRRVNRLISDLLTMTKLDSKELAFNFTKVSIEEVVRDVIQNLELEAKEKNLEITSYFPPLPLIEGDPDRLSQVFQNLIENAIKFTPKGGDISISARKRGYSFFISVKDTGIGISQENMPKIFNKFYQVDSGLARKYGGSGLGLTICQGIVKAHAGEIKVKSERRKGTCFEVILPYKKLGKPTEAFGQVLGGGGKI